MNKTQKYDHLRETKIPDKYVFLKVALNSKELEGEKVKKKSFDFRS